MFLLTFDFHNNNNKIYLQDNMAPQVEGEGGSNATDNGNDMVLPKLDSFSENFVVVIIWWYDLVSHAGGTYCLSIFM